MTEHRDESNVAPVAEQEDRARELFLEVNLKIKDRYGREAAHAASYELVKLIPAHGATTGWVLTTGLTSVDLQGVRAEVEIKRRS